ncbi:MAG: hypothetical protein FWB99_01980 [Treponema sp.]|nr:hypothetical protein [Treponema sp.]
MFPSWIHGPLRIDSKCSADGFQVSSIQDGGVDLQEANTSTSITAAML